MSSLLETERLQNIFMDARFYNPADRAREKQAARDLDEQQIASGEKTPAQVQQQNAAFAFPGARVKFRKR